MDKKKRLMDVDTAQQQNLSLRQRKRAKQEMGITPLSTVDPTSRTINVTEFAQARANEIMNMQKALSNATEFSGIQRVFQRLPRYMRRRAASHNPKRVPEKKRQLAIAQMLRDPTPAKPKTRKAKRKPGNIVAHFANRKIEKQWLETHIWHAKRFRMKNMWGYRIPIKPNEHSVRSAYRAAKHQAVMYDVSYMQCVEIIGIEEDFRVFFEQCFDASVNVLGKRYTNGSSQGHTFVYQQKKYPLKVISPVSFFWKQEKLCDNLQTSKTLWVWIHPAALFQTLSTLSNCNPSGKLTIKHLASEVNRFEIYGPRSFALLHQVLKVVPESPLHTIWETLKHAIPGNITSNQIIALQVHDPRLPLPPKMQLRQTASPDETANLLSLITSWPKNISASQIFSSEYRQILTDTKIRALDINNRRKEQIIPSDLVPTPEDAKIPLLLIINKTGISLILPKNWAKEFFVSLTFAGVHTSGLESFNFLQHDAQLSVFPDDYTTTKAHQEYISLERKELVEVWNRKPKNRRAYCLEEDLFEGMLWRLCGKDVNSKWMTDCKNEKKLAENSLENKVVEEFESSTWEDRYSGMDLIVSPLVLSQIKAQLFGQDVIELPFDCTSTFVRTRLVMNTGSINKHAVIFNAQKDISTYTRDDVLGYVTSASYSLEEGRCICFGVCSIARLLQFRSKQRKYSVRVRDLNSKLGYFANLELVE